MTENKAAIKMAKDATDTDLATMTETAYANFYEVEEAEGFFGGALASKAWTKFLIYRAAQVARWKYDASIMTPTDLSTRIKEFRVMVLRHVGVNAYCANQYAAKRAIFEKVLFQKRGY